MPEPGSHSVIAMLSAYFVSCSLLALRPPGESPPALPAWIHDNPAFRHPLNVDATKTPGGSLAAHGNATLSWMVTLNDRPGHGVQVEVKRLAVDPDLEEYVLIAGWAWSGCMGEMRVMTGRVEGEGRTVRMPNTRAFQVLYSGSRKSSRMAVEYRRYGAALHPDPRPTDNPSKRKETLFEVQLRGRPPTDYSLPDFSSLFKTALSSIARRYAQDRNIPFDDSIPIQEMVQLHRVSFCPWEWPDRDTCASLQHSIFISGSRDTHQDYQLIADHLSAMWAQKDLPELAELGLTVYLLPRTTPTVLYWSLFILATTAFSLAGILFWRRQNVVKESSHRSVESGAKKGRKAKASRRKRERIPSFMQAEEEAKEAEPREKFGGGSTQEDAGTLPIKNYFGSILFGSNRAFEDDEEGPLELRSASAIK